MIKSRLCLSVVVCRLTCWVSPLSATKQQFLLPLSWGLSWMLKSPTKKRNGQSQQWLETAVQQCHRKRFWGFCRYFRTRLRVRIQRTHHTFELYICMGGKSLNSGGWLDADSYLKNPFLTCGVFSTCPFTPKLLLTVTFCDSGYLALLDKCIQSLQCRPSSCSTVQAMKCAKKKKKKDVTLTYQCQRASAPLFNQQKKKNISRDMPVEAGVSSRGAKRVGVPPALLMGSKGEILNWGTLVTEQILN